MFFCRPPVLQELESSLTSPTSSRSMSAGWCDPSIPPSAPSPTTPSWSISTRAPTLWSISSTTPRWTCKFPVGGLETQQRPRRARSLTFFFLFFFTSLQVVLFHRFEGQQWELHQHPEHGPVQGATFSRSLRSRAQSHFVCRRWLWLRRSFLPPGYQLHHPSHHATAGRRAEDGHLRAGCRIQPDIPVRAITDFCNLSPSLNLIIKTSWTCIHPTAKLPLKLWKKPLKVCVCECNLIFPDEALLTVFKGLEIFQNLNNMIKYFTENLLVVSKGVTATGRKKIINSLNFSA